MISLINITKKYKHSVLALDNICLTLPNKGLVALVGENGCGKTTLLNILATIDKQTIGEIYYNNLPYNRHSYRYLRNSIVSYIQQENIFSEYLSVYENIKIIESDKDQIKEKFELFNIEDKIDSKAYALSGGQRQKCSVIRGMIKKSAVLLVDEPTSSMDKKTETITFQLLKEISQSKLVVVVSHNMQLIEEYSDLIIHMERGRIIDIINATNRELIVKDNIISVPNDEMIILSDWIKIKKVLQEKKQVSLELNKSSSRNKNNLDYSVIEKNNKKIESKSTKCVGRIAFKSLLSSPVKIIISSIFVAFLVVLSGISLCLSNINITEFEYEMFLKNGYDVVNFSTKENVDILESNLKGEFGFSEYKNFQEKYNVPSVALSNFENVSFGFDYNEVYSSFVSGFALINSESQYELLFGTLPLDNQIMITDYIADNFMLNDLYESYDEILKYGFVLNNYNFGVSGIIDTNYEDYLKQMDTMDFKNSENYVEWCYMLENVYTRFYIKDYYFNNSKLNMIPINYGQQFANVRIKEDLSDDSLNLDNYIYVNEKFFNILEGMDSIKTFNGAYSINGVINDDEKNPVIYVTSNQYDELVQNAFSFSSFNLDIENYDAYEYINSYSLQHNTPISSTINKAIDIVQIIDKYLNPIIVTLMVCTVILSSLFWFDLSSKDKFVLYLFVTNGYSCFQVQLFSIIKCIVKFLLELLLSIICYFTVANGVNDVMSNISLATMILIPQNIYPLIISFVLYEIIMFIIITFYSFNIIFKSPIKLYITSKK